MIVIKRLTTAVSFRARISSKNVKREASFLVRLKGNSKLISSNSLSPLVSQNKDLGAASQTSRAPNVNFRKISVRKTI